jgi:hypothetical protein
MQGQVKNQQPKRIEQDISRDAERGLTTLALSRSTTKRLGRRKHWFRNAGQESAAPMMERQPNVEVQVLGATRGRPAQSAENQGRVSSVRHMNDKASPGARGLRQFDAHDSGKRKDDAPGQMNARCKPLATATRNTTRSSSGEYAGEIDGPLRGGRMEGVVQPDVARTRETRSR